MLNTLMISSPITPIMANYIIHHSPESYKWETSPSNKDSSRHTESLKYLGIIDLNIWVNTKKIIAESFAVANCQLNVLLDAKVVTHMDDIIGELYSLLPDYPQNYLKDFVVDYNFTVKAATFTYNFTGNSIAQYYYLLRGGYDLSNIHMKKVVSEDRLYDYLIHTTEYCGEHNTSIPSTLQRYYESLHITIEHRELIYSRYPESDGKKKKNIIEIQEEQDITYSTDRIVGYPLLDPNIDMDDETIKAIQKKDRLQIKINLKRNKISRICKQLKFKSKDPNLFFQNAQKIDKIVFIDYMKHITGIGKYYKYKDAEKIIDAAETFPNERKITHKRKARMKDVLKGVSSYKGVSTFLDHVEDEEITYPCMASVRKRSIALTLLREIQSLGICPFNLSVRSKTKELDNLITVYEAATSDTLTK